MTTTGSWSPESSGTNLWRVVRVDRGSVVVSHAGDMRRLDAAGLVVGDWVEVAQDDSWTMRARRTVVSRQMVDKSSREQVLAANVDVVAVVEAVYPGVNMRRVERMLALAWSSGARPAVILTKADLTSDNAAADVAAVAAIAPGVDVLGFSAVTGYGASDIRPLLGADQTFVLLGPSGVGKSSLGNFLSDSGVLMTGGVRSDGRGRHVTTHRQLIEMPNGGALIDTPGIRSVGLTVGLDSIFMTFEDVVEHIGWCNFSDCRHKVEPGCGLQSAVENGLLGEDRVTSFLALLDEASLHAERRTVRDRRAERVDTRGRRQAKRVAMRGKGRLS